MSSETIFCIQSDGSIIKRTTSINESRVVPGDRLTKMLLQDFFRLIPLSVGTWAAVTTEETWMIRCLPSISVLASWSPFETGEEVILRQSRSDAVNAVRMAMEWLPPHRHAKILFATSVVRAEGTDPSWSVFDKEKCYIFLLNTQSGVVFKPPFSNIYADGRICMGRTEVPMAKNMAGALDSAVAMFQSTPYNKDLWAPDIDQSVANSFKVTADGPKQVFAEGWETGLTTIASPQTRFITEILK